MSRLMANLKMYYQRRILWIVYAVMALIAAPGVFVEHGENVFLVLPGFMLFAGILAGSMQLEIMNKLFAWPLPGHARINAKVLFIIGGGVSLLWAVALLFLPADTWGDRCMTSACAFFFALASYWFGVFMIFKSSNASFVFSLIPLAWFAFNFLEVHQMILKILSDYWAPAMGLVILENIFAWRILTRKGFSRKFCAKNMLSAFDAWNPEKVRRFGQKKMVRQAACEVSEDPRIDNFFLKRIAGRPVMDRVKYVWGAFYSHFGVICLRKKDWTRFFVVMAPILCVLGYMQPSADFLFLMPGLMVANMHFGVRSGLPIPAGRKERFWAVLPLALAITLSATAVVSLLAALTLPLMAILPSVTIKGHHFVYQAMDLRLFMMPLFMIPIGLAIKLVFFRHARVMYAGVLLFFVLMTQMLFNQDLVILKDLYVISIHSGLLILGSWFVFAAVLRHICQSRSLA